ncbi:fibronectin type III domain-containing protein [Cellulomonas alba]|uniref:Fibronectin type III domain-containing protein n=1 Tax=Cellulomonas alba TaxID=3053467 RepID=A0ABT7SIA9_9CELL|nr:fibronectin type III domain-containing protein [Cellulomonas alba]MDM7855905.1 fibronectin type III domain-containing protein [Cellulomonas alba]
MPGRPAGRRPSWSAALGAAAATAALAVAWTTPAPSAPSALDRTATVAADAAAGDAGGSSGATHTPGATARAVPAPATARTAAAPAHGVAAPAPARAARAATTATVDPSAPGTTPAVVGPDGFEYDTSVPVANPPKARKHVRVLIVPVYWSWNPRDSATTSTLRSLGVTQLDRYYREVSRGRVGISGSVAPWTKISATGLACEGLESRLVSRALAAAKKKGYKPSAYDRVEIYHPSCSSYWAGMAQLGTSSSPGRYLVIDGTPYLSVFAHEMGHTLGLDHANAYRCKASGVRVTLAASCSAAEYGDGFDDMGDIPSSGSFATPHLAQLHWLTSTQTKVVTRSVSNVRLTPLVGPSAGVKTIRVKASRTRTYWVELRQHAGVDSKLSPGGVGVEVRMTDSRVRAGTRGATLLLDLQPQNAWSSVTLPAASAWTSPEGVRITVSRLTSATATVSVRYHAPKPTRPSRPAVTATPGDTTARVTVARPAGNGSVVQSYTVRAVPAGGGTTVTKKVDAAAAASRSVALTGLRNGTAYAVSATARNEKGSSSWSAAVTVTPLALPPVVTLTSPAAGATVAGATLAVAGTVAPRAGSTATLTSIDLDVSQPSGGEAYWSTSGWWTATHAFGTSLDVSSLLDGPATLTVTATDSNNRTTRVTRTVTVRGHSPTLAIDPSTITGTAADGFDIAYTATPATGRSLTSMEATLTGSDGFSVWSDWWLPGGGTETFHADLGGWFVEPGSYTLELVLSDGWATVTVDVPVTLT